MKPIYFWNEGPDSRHFTSTKVFHRLSDAKAMIDTISASWAFKIVRQDEKENKTVMERIV